METTTVTTRVTWTGPHSSATADRILTMVEEITVEPDAPMTVSCPVLVLLLIADEKIKLSIFDGAAPV